MFKPRDRMVTAGIVAETRGGLYGPHAVVVTEPTGRAYTMGAEQFLEQFEAEGDQRSIELVRELRARLDAEAESYGQALAVPGKAC